MENKSQAGNGELDHLKQRIADLEERMTRIEKEAADPGIERTVQTRVTQAPGDESSQKMDIPLDDSMESKIGEYGMAWQHARAFGT